MFLHLGHALLSFSIVTTKWSESIWVMVSVKNNVYSSRIRNTYRWRSTTLNKRNSHTWGRLPQGLITEERNIETTPSSEISENALPQVYGVKANQKGPQVDRNRERKKKDPSGQGPHLCGSLFS